MVDALRALLGNATVLTGWWVAVLASVALLVWDMVVRRAGYRAEAAEAERGDQDAEPASGHSAHGGHSQHAPSYQTPIPEPSGAHLCTVCNCEEWGAREEPGPRDVHAGMAHGAGLGGWMIFVWALVVLYIGPIGLAIYWWAGRLQPGIMSLLKRATRSTAHCYSGCGVGEVLGIVLVLGVLRGDILATVLATFLLAYLFGFALTIGPMLQAGAPFGMALRDTVASDTVTIFIMEVVAVGMDLVLASDATISQPLFWTALPFGLLLGFIAAYPANLLLVRMGIKHGM